MADFVVLLVEVGSDLLLVVDHATSEPVGALQVGPAPPLGSVDDRQNDACQLVAEPALDHVCFYQIWLQFHYLLAPLAVPVILRYAVPQFSTVAGLVDGCQAQGAYHYFVIVIGSVV